MLQLLGFDDFLLLLFTLSRRVRLGFSEKGPFRINWVSKRSFLPASEMDTTGNLYV